MTENGSRPSRAKSAITLNNKFYDTSCEDSSSTGSGETASTEECRRFIETMKKNPLPARPLDTRLEVPSEDNSTNRELTSECNNSSNMASSSYISVPGSQLLVNYQKILKTQITAKSPFRAALAKFVHSKKETGNDDQRRSMVCLRYFITVVLVFFWVFCTATLIEKKEKVSNIHQLSIPKHVIKSYWIHEHHDKERLSITLEGAFIPNYYANLSTRHLQVWVEAFENDPGSGFYETTIRNLRMVSEVTTLPIVSEHILDDVTVPNLRIKKEIEISDEQATNQTYMRIQLQTNMKSAFPVSLTYDLSAVTMEYGVIYAALVLALLYFLIIFEIVHRTLAGMLAAAMSVAILAALDERPSVSMLASWIDFETLLLLFSMMVLVAVFSETGVFDYMSVCAYRITNGRVWPLINTLSVFTFFLSSFLDNVTTALLMTPVTIRLCEVTELNPIPVLMAMTIFSNIGGAVTPVGDPPNAIVVSNPDVAAAGVSFGVFFVHMAIGIGMVAIVVHIYLRIIFRQSNVLHSEEPLDVQDLRKEIAIWERAAASLSLYSKEEETVKETLLKRVRRLLSELKIRVTDGTTSPPVEHYKKNLNELKAKYPIKNKILLLKSGIALLFVIVVFFLHSIPELHLSLGCTAFMGALLLLILADHPHLEGILARVEWTTLLFFGSLFILMEGLSRLRLIEWIGQRTEHLILGVSHKYQLSVAILLILWVSATVSAFVDNIPLTTMMIRIITSLANNPELNLPLLPLVWALCYGACLGGMATLIGSSSNVVCAGVAEQHGYRFSFLKYSKMGLPVSIASLVLISAYLMLAHVVLGWN